MPPRPTSDSLRRSSDPAFRHLPAEGAIRSSDQRRAAAIPVEFVQGLHANLTKELGDAARRTLYACGYEWALQDMVHLNQRLRTEPGSGNLDLWQMDARFVLDSWWEPLSDAGWGVWTLDLTTQAKGITFVDLHQSAVVVPPASPRPPARLGAGQPVCHLYAGLFAGALSFIERGENHAVEIQCAALGHPSCRFVIGPGAQIDAVESWRQQGIGADEIRRRLT